MKQSTRVLFDVNPSDTGFPFHAVASECQLATDTERHIVLRDLVTLGEVRIEVVLAVEFAIWRNRAPEREPGAKDRFNGCLIDDRQCARQAHANRTDVGI